MGIFWCGNIYNNIFVKLQYFCFYAIKTVAYSDFFCYNVLARLMEADFVAA